MKGELSHQFFFFGFGLQGIKMVEFNKVFPKWSRAFIESSEFSEFWESDKSLKHELGSI